MDDRGTQTVSGSKIQIDANDKMLSHEFWFAPTCIVAKAGTTLSVTVKNIGQTLHNFSIQSMKFDKDIPSGKSLQLRVKIPPQDSVVFFCKYHPGAGMQGAFVAGQP